MVKSNSRKKINLIDRIKQSKFGKVPTPEMLIKLGYYLFLVIIVPLLFPSERSFKYTDVTVGSITNKKVIAPFTFSVLKTEKELAAERQAAVKDVLPVFVHYDSIAREQIEKLRLFIGDVRPLDADTTVTPDSLRNMAQDLSFRLNISVSENDLLQLSRALDKKRNLSRTLLSSLEDLYTKNYLNIPLSTIDKAAISIIRKGIEEEVPVTDCIDQPVFGQSVAAVDSTYHLTRVLRKFAKPAILFDNELTEQRRREAIASVPTAKDIVYENERIVDANERITEDIYQKLYSLEVATAERGAQHEEVRNILSVVSRFILTGLILYMLVIYLAANRPRIFRNNKKLLLLTLLIFIQIGLGAIFVNTLNWSLYVIPTTISSMLLGILFDPGVGFVGTVIIALLLGGITGFDYTFIVMTLFVGLVSIYSVTHIRTRNHIFRAILYILLAYSGVVLTFSMLRFEEWDEIFRILVFFILPNAILSPFITYMSLGIFERLFDITTDITLLELSDLNHPLLKELALKAPGTFHHSIIVGNLSESAAKSIGANSLLARVGSYYHDIGKMVKPEYFVENEQGGENKHESLAPNMSALILASHVKSGLELAEKHNLPRIISDFIPEHHGRNLMSFFYNKALQTKEESEVNDEDYRYPGPSPQSKETAIVMLADTVEAAVRTLKNPTASRIRKMVEDLVEKRFLEGELDHSELTMRDLKGIIDGFMSVLTGIYHKRIEYPDGEESKKTGQKK